MLYKFLSKTLSNEMILDKSIFIQHFKKAFANDYRLIDIMGFSMDIKDLSLTVGQMSMTI